MYTKNEFAFVGRSNAGKSSLINALTNNKNLYTRWLIIIKRYCECKKKDNTSSLLDITVYESEHDDNPFIHHHL